MAGWIRATLTLLVLVAGFLIVNGLASFGLKDWQLDLTEERLYSLSPGTRSLLAGLEEPVQLELFFSARAARDLPRVRQYARRVEELLTSYVQLAGGRLSLEVIDPEPFSVAEERAVELGLQGVPLALGESLYLGLVGHNAEGRQAVIPLFALDQERFLEYELSRLLFDLSRSRRPVVGLMSDLPLEGGFVPGLGEQPVWTVLEQVRQQFDVEFIDTAADEIPAGVDVLWLVHPKELPQHSLYAIDQFVLGGGRLLAFVDPLSGLDTQQDLQRPLGEGRASQLDSLLEAWGLRMLPEQVLGDASFAMQVVAGDPPRPVRHLVWLTVTEQGLSAEDVVTARLGRINLASAGVLEALEDATTTFTPLLYSSTAAMPFAAARLNVLSHPGELYANMEPTGERYTLAARISGPASTAFPEGLEGRLPGLQTAEEIQAVVIADTDLLGDALWLQDDGSQSGPPQPWADNGHLVLNALEHLSGSQALLQIRAGGHFSRPFTLVERIRESAEERFRDKEQQLQLRLARLEEQMADLQVVPEPGLDSSVEEQLLLQQYRQELLQVRKELREVRYQQNADIESLGQVVKAFNLLLMPLVLVIILILVSLHRRSKKLAG